MGVILFFFILTFVLMIFASGGWFALLFLAIPVLWVLSKLLYYSALASLFRSNVTVNIYEPEPKSYRRRRRTIKDKNGNMIEEELEYTIESPVHYTRDGLVDLSEYPEGCAL